VVIEADQQAGGISKTVDYLGNKIDIGGHRFFSKSDKVLNWWQQFLPIQAANLNVVTTYQQQTKSITINKPLVDDGPHMLLRPRKSRIYYNKKFFDYPLKLGLGTFLKIGVLKSIRILTSILYRRLKPITVERNLEDFYINRFGDELYTTFFKAYTEKVWGKPCHAINADWGRQRVKELGIRTIVKHYLTSKLFPDSQNFTNQRTERTLAEYFLYPQQGPGQLWEAVANACTQSGVEIRYQQTVNKIDVENNRVKQVTVADHQTGQQYQLDCDVIISSMAVRDLTLAMGDKVPKHIQTSATQLEYRDFMVIGLLIKKGGQGITNEIDDNWLYIQDDNVKVGRLQLFHNWSPHMVANEEHLWLGAEYFCQQGDELWNTTDNDLINFAAEELATLGLIDVTDKQGGVVVRMPKAYPSYVGAYNHFESIRGYFDAFPNLYLVGRNGMHKYNNQDHSMLTAMEAVDNIMQGKTTKANIWDIISGQEYIES